MIRAFSILTGSSRVAIVPPAILMSRGWRNCSIDWQVAFGHRGVDLISDALPYGRLWYAEPLAVSNAINYAKFFSRSHDAMRPRAGQ
jgi:hypothetical protein